jgi:transporter family-2 protein
VLNVLNAVAAIAIGVCLSLQPPINAAMARIVGSSLLASCISIAISLLVVVPVWLGAGGGAGDLGQVRSLPWWVALGGVIGVVFVAGGIVLAPTMGVALFFVCVVAGQLLGSTVADHFGAFGMDLRPLSTMRLLGFGLVLLGAALVHRSG